jgi:hypothetical protein
MGRDRRRIASADDDFSRPEEKSQGGWPGWARGLASAAVVFHLTALLGAVLGGGLPASELQLAWHEKFKGYYDFLDLGYPYRYYAPEPPPTPVAFAKLLYDDGRPPELIRIPNRDVRPILRYQRQLALAYHLTSDFEEAVNATRDGTKSLFARSYARHLCSTHPGCVSVLLYIQAHLIPPMDRAREAWSRRGGERFNPDADEYYNTPERIGEFRCDAL